MQKFYITTAIDYVNGKPHLGHVLEKVQADITARYKRLGGFDVFFLTGTDEHGAKNAKAAKDAQKSVVEFTNKNAEAFENLWRDMDISYDYFIRTTNKTRHWPVVKRVWRVLEKNGDLYKNKYKGLYCYGHEAFVTTKDLNKNGECEMHGQKPEQIEEENYFFKLSKYTKQIKASIKKGEMKITPKERENEILRLLEGGLEDVSFSRPRKDLKWGIPVPGDKTQTIYVWADALTNYISALGWGEKDSGKFKKYWPADVHVIGKDILRFHAAIWPGMLLSLGLPLPKKLFVHGFINVDGKKMSKSLGNIIAPVDIVNEYGVDAFRHYLLTEIMPTRDGDFSKEKFEARYNGDLASGLGNFMARIVGLGERHLKKPLKSITNAATKTKIEKSWKTYSKNMEEMKFSDAIREAYSLMSYGDKRINDVKLWELAQNDNKKFEAELSDVATILANVAWMLYPAIPASSEKIFRQLGIKSNSKDNWKFKMKKGESLFPRLQ
ncbi:MAG: methionine--tRNA ligase [Candidatus Spechtbacterales bacterium]